ncbi:hypothetical protein [Henriciella sp.]|uniref:DUF6998 domain-containing protein n=1 Tax=Henriciella sp. TaxID=1968823 RepID=UPI00262581DA|nr:hypothetical protein [Henriciella sp.]
MREIEILKQVKKLAVEYYDITGKPLGVTGEIAEVEAAQHLGLELTEARTEGYDAVRRDGNNITRIQIKGRWKRQGKNWGRVGSINTTKAFDTVMLVLMQGRYEVAEIWEAPRAAILDRLSKPGSKSRNERGSLGVSQFKSIATLIWPSVYD